jgi:hypothetical protein
MAVVHGNVEGRQPVAPGSLTPETGGAYFLPGGLYGFTVLQGLTNQGLQILPDSQSAEEKYKKNQSHLFDLLGFSPL